MSKYEITIPNPEQVPTSSLKVDGKNPNKMTREQLDRLKTSIQKYGFIVPIITNKDLLIADGEQRWIAAKELAMPNVLVVRLPVAEVDRHLIRQVMNKLRGEHDFLLDAQEFEEIIHLGKEDDLKYLLDLTDGKLERYLRELHPPKDETYEPPPIESIETTIKIGDLIQLGNHYLLCGDATNPQHVDQLITQKINLVFTDPPYNVDYSSKNEFLNKADEGNRIQTPIANDKCDIEPLLSKTWHNIKPHLADYNAVYVCGVGSSLHNLFDTLENNQYYISQVLVWVKNNVVLGRQDYLNQHEFILYGWSGKHRFYGENPRTVWQVNKPNKNDLHPTMKPIELISIAIINSSQPKEAVLDVFGGSGSTLMACEQTQRVCYTMELEPRYCEVICQRWESYTGQKRKLVKNSENDVSPTSN